MMKSIPTLLFVLTLTMACGTDAQAQQTMETVLTPRQQSLSAIACLEAKGDQTHLASAINEGFDNGLTVSEIKEALSQLYAYTGFPRSLNGLGTLQKVVADRKAQGQATEEGSEASPLSADYDALKQGTDVQTRLTGRAFNYTFAPATDYYLKAHLFGDIFARDNLSFADRELVTVSALAGIEGVTPQLLAHVSGSRNMGVKDDELRALPQNLLSRVGADEAYRAAKAVAQVLGDPFDETQRAREFRVGIADSPYPVGNSNTGFAQYFIGNSYLAPMDGANGGPSNVTFEPRCRNNWHIHHKAVQVLICVAGRGWYQEWGKPAVELRPGTVIAIPAEVKHWHGAAADSWMQHLAYMTRVEEGASNEWLEPVDDAAYDQIGK